MEVPLTLSCNNIAVVSLAHRNAYTSQINLSALRTSVYLNNCATWLQTDGVTGCQHQQNLKNNSTLTYALC